MRTFLHTAQPKLNTMQLHVLVHVQCTLYMYNVHVVKILLYMYCRVKKYM